VLLLSFEIRSLSVLVIQKRVQLQLESSKVLDGEFIALLAYEESMVKIVVK
jgi:hypothetical protein